MYITRTSACYMSLRLEFKKQYAFYSVYTAGNETSNGFDEKNTLFKTPTLLVGRRTVGKSPSCARRFTTVIAHGAVLVFGANVFETPRPEPRRRAVRSKGYSCPHIRDTSKSITFVLTENQFVEWFILSRMTAYKCGPLIIYPEMFAVAFQKRKLQNMCLTLNDAFLHNLQITSRTQHLWFVLPIIHATICSFYPSNNVSTKVLLLLFFLSDIFFIWHFF